MRYEDENIWLTQKMMATLYDVDVRTINEHIKKIYSDSELEEDSTIRNFRIVQTEGSRQVTRDTKHYNLQMIIAVGFKVNTERAVQFRKWVNQIVKDYTIKGWVMACLMAMRDKSLTTASAKSEKFIFPVVTKFARASSIPEKAFLTAFSAKLAKSPISF